MTDDGVKRHGERVGENGGLVSDPVRYRDQHRVVRGEQVRPGARCARGDPDVNSRTDRARREAEAESTGRLLRRPGRQGRRPEARR